jgi:hypothetical protein
MSTTGKDIHFYAPGIRKFETSEFSGNSRQFVTLSVTGTQCALMCDHCEAKVLRTMTPVAPDNFFEICKKLKEQGAHGVLLSGGCDSKGRVPLSSYLPELRKVNEELGLALRIHTGLVSEEVVQGIADIKVDGVMLDIIGARETIEKVYHLDLDVDEYERSLDLLARYEIPSVPHIVIGLHFGKFLGEWEALEIIERHPRKAVVLVVLQPLYGTAMALTPSPELSEIGDFFSLCRERLFGTPLFLGCARPLGNMKREIDRMAVDCGMDGIAYPAEGIVSYAQVRGRVPHFQNACCGVGWEE